jgi:hypothetical protein
MLTGSPNLNIENIDFSNQKCVMKVPGSRCPQPEAGVLKKLSLAGLA